MRGNLFICDAQVHAPRVADPAWQVNGIDVEPLLDEMDTAGVDRAIIVPLSTQREAAHNVPALELAHRHPERFSVMGLVDPTQARRTRDQLVRWRDTPGLLGIRLNCFREPLRSRLARRELDWLWKAAGEYQIPIMLRAPDMVAEIARTAAHFPSVRIAIDHLGLRPFHPFSDIVPQVTELLPLSTYSNVTLKATALPISVCGPYPFRGAHEGLRMAVEAFGPERIFWGSDLSRLPCTYSESITMFTEELPFLTASDLEMIMGRAICQWLGWPVRPAASAS
jgi:predicted TIM-barrel fold metal-dependent hydrolase